MKKMSRMKKLCCATLILGMMLPQVVGSGDVSEAASGTWRHTSKGWWYSYSDGSYAVNDWVQYGGKWYYFGADGYMVTGWKQIAKKWYFFDKNGAMVTGWKQDGGKWYYFGTNGAMVTGWKLIGRKWYFFANGVMVTGWKQISGKWYFFSNGAMVTGAKTIKGKAYLFDDDGVWIDLSKLKAGDVITLGEYEQDNNLSNGQEPIEWTVLDKRSDGKLLVVSKYILDGRKYNDKDIDVTWETCTLRKWMNSTFLNTAFTEEEQALIPNVIIKNADNPEYGIAGGNDTKDQVFLLSYDEAKKYYKDEVYNDPEEYPEDWIYSDKRKCTPTAYAEAQKVRKYVYEDWMEHLDYLNADGGLWWLRSPGSESDQAMVTYYDGHVWEEGYNVDFVSYYHEIIGVRPAMYITP